MNPATRLALFMALAASISRLPVLLAGAILLLALLGPRRAHLARLLWRSRWLLLILFLGYGWTLPGEPLVPGVVSFWMPSLEGLHLSAAQVLRLVAMLAALDALLLALPAERLLGGLLIALRLLPRRLCPDPERVALRLWLTLRAIEDSRFKLQGSRMLDALRRMDTQACVSGETVMLRVEPLRGLDRLVLVAVLLALLLGLTGGLTGMLAWRA